MSEHSKWSMIKSVPLNTVEQRVKILELEENNDVQNIFYTLKLTEEIALI